MRIAALLLAALVSACTTTSFDSTPRPVLGAEADTFKFKVFIRGFAGGDAADRAVVADIEAFKKANGFASHRIVTRQFDAFPPSYEYFVRLSR